MLAKQRTNLVCHIRTRASRVLNAVEGATERTADFNCQTKIYMITTISSFKEKSWEISTEMSQKDVQMPKNRASRKEKYLLWW